MRTAVLITSAGLSSRFSKSIGYDVLKCIYNTGNYLESVLSIQLELLKRHNIQDIYIVGGYLFNQLQEFIDDHYKSLNIHLVYNEYYKQGSCYSLTCGIKEIEKNRYIDNIIFMEGDLYIPNHCFSQILNAKQNVITFSNMIIESDKSVIFYRNTDGIIKYIYDTNHSNLFIPEEFTMLGNSGQVWKIINIKDFYDIIINLTDRELFATNLIPIGKYIEKHNNIDIININPWINCNTINDYNKIMELIHE